MILWRKSISEYFEGIMLSRGFWEDGGIWAYSADLKYAFCVGLCTNLYLARLIIAKDEG